MSTESFQTAEKIPGGIAERQRLAAEIREWVGPLTDEGVYVGVSAWPAERAAGYTAAIDEILEEVLAGG